MAVRYAVLSSISGLLSLIFYIGVLVVVLVRRRRLQPRAARLAVWSAVVLLIGVVASIAMPLVLGGVLSQVDSAPDYTTLFMLLNLVTGLIHLAAIALLLLALFANQPDLVWAGPVLPTGPVFPAGPVLSAGPEAAPGSEA